MMHMNNSFIHHKYVLAAASYMNKNLLILLAFMIIDIHIIVASMNSEYIQNTCKHEQSLLSNLSLTVLASTVRKWKTRRGRCPETKLEVSTKSGPKTKLEVNTNLLYSLAQFQL